MADHAFCIHGHFYQPPREDPLTGEIPEEPGAKPYRNWNERIYEQCYKPNAELGNFEHISFDLGPTLAEWMAEEYPETLAMIIEQEKRNVARYGVGNAMAQAYNHTILPLSPRHDKETQVRWGIQDFECRFGHKPSGMWLPESAVDTESLEVMVENGIQYTILAPWQAQDPNLDISKPYRVALPGNKEIIVFFYHQELSMRVSFDPSSTVNADAFVQRNLRPKFSNGLKKFQSDQLLVIASDGELYGHHQPFRDKFLAYLLDGALKDQPLRGVFPSLWLQEHPVKETAKISSDTSWSCHHGIKRWSGECECTPHGEWKAPLRFAFNQIADVLDDQFEEIMRPYFSDPWKIRHEYGDVLCGKSINVFVKEKFGDSLDDREAHKIKLILEAQYERQRMFTSCGWFFDDFDRIEPRNNVAYAAQAVWLSYLATGKDLSEDVIDWLSAVKSWRSGLTADVVFTNYLMRARNIQQVRGYAFS